MGSWGYEGGVCTVVLKGDKPGATQSTVSSNCVPVLREREQEPA